MKNKSLKNKNPESAESTKSEAVETAYKKIAELRSRGNHSDAEASYAIGVEVARIKRDEKKYGAGAVEQIAIRLHCTAASLYAYASVAETWDKTTFDAALAKKNAAGVSLTFSHFIDLARVKDPTKRDRLLGAALREAWSVRELRARLPEGPTRGRTPPSITHELGRMNASYSSLLDRTKAHVTVLRELAAAPAADTVPTPDQVSTLLETIEGVIRFGEQLVDVLNELKVKCEAMPEPVTSEAAE